METIEHIDERGRKFRAFSNGGENVIIIGPPEGLVDELYLPEPIATRLHNALYDRGILTYQNAIKARNGLLGVLQEVLMIDAQLLLEKFSKYDQPTGGSL